MLVGIGTWEPSEHVTILELLIQLHAQGNFKLAEIWMLGVSMNRLGAASSQLDILKIQEFQQVHAMLMRDLQAH